MKEVESIRRDFLREASDDYVGLWSLIRRIKFDLGYNDPATVRAVTLSILKELLAQGLIRAGIPHTTGDFEEWNLSPVKTLQRLEHEWDGLGREPNIGDIVWFTSTEKGEKHIRAS